MAASGDARGEAAARKRTCVAAHSAFAEEAALVLCASTFQMIQIALVQGGHCLATELYVVLCLLSELILVLSK